MVFKVPSAMAAALLALALPAILPGCRAAFPAPGSLPNPAAQRAGPRGPGGYACGGSQCCDYTCSSGQETCARSPNSGFWVPKTWLTEEGFESCAVKVATNYDRSIACSKALGPGQICGGDTAFACGYGLACVASDIGLAQCQPVCGLGLDSPRLSRSYLGAVASGCTLDGQSGTTNTQNGRAGGGVDVGEVDVTGGFATPACIAGVDGASTVGPHEPFSVPGELRAETFVPGGVSQQAGTGSGAVGGPAAEAAVAAANAAGRVGGGAGGGAARRLLQTTTSGPKARRQSLANEVARMTTIYYESKLMGYPQPTSKTKFPYVWTWKRPGFADPCATLVSQQPAAQTALFRQYPGYQDAGSAPEMTITLGFTTAQYAMSMKDYAATYAGTPSNPIATAKCRTATDGTSTIGLLERQLRYMMNALAGMILTYDSAATFEFITGVGDSSAFSSLEPSWNQPAKVKDVCYVANAAKPAADIAGQLAAGLALAADYFQTAYAATAPPAGSEAAQALADITGNDIVVRAKTAYAYAKAQYATSGESAVCSNSAAASNCIGAGCATSSSGPCDLYCFCYGGSCQRYIFTAAAALWTLTGDATYRTEAQNFYDAGNGPGASGNSEFVYYFNWYNSWQMGMTLMMNKLGAGGARDAYRTRMRSHLIYDGSNYGFTESDAHYNCVLKAASTGGRADRSANCAKTVDGYTYPVQVAWGNTALVSNQACIAARLALHPDTAAGDKAKLACYAGSQLGYLLNHKLSSTSQSAYRCRPKTVTATTGGDATPGFSLMVGMGAKYPKRLHDRDSSYNSATNTTNFGSDTVNDPNLFCGAMPSGPFIDPPSSGTDCYTDTRGRYQESEPALDYVASTVCATAAFAQLDDSLFTGCSAITPYRNVLQGY